MVVAALEVPTKVSFTVDGSLNLMSVVKVVFLFISVSTNERFRFCRRCAVMNSGVVVQPGGEDRSTAARGRERQW